MKRWVASTGPTGGLWLVDRRRAPRKVVDLPDCNFVLGDGPRVIALSGHAQSSLDVFAVAPGRLTLQRGILLSGGEPCFAAQDPRDPSRVVVVCYDPPAVEIIDRQQGGAMRLPLPQQGSGVLPDRQLKPHPHQAVFVTTDDLLVTVLGGDCLRHFTRGETGQWDFRSDIPCPPGSGPRHLVAAGDQLVVSAELSAQVLVSPVADALAGGPTWSSARSSGFEHSSALTPGTSPICYPSDIQATQPDTVWVCNRGLDTVAQFRLGSGAPELVEEHPSGGAWPMCLDVRDGSPVVACRDDDILAHANGSRDRVPAPVWFDDP